MGRLLERDHYHHHKELTCENGRDELKRRDGRTGLTLLKRRRCCVLVMTFPFGLM